MATILSMKSVGSVPGARLVMNTVTNNDITLSLNDGRTFVLKQYLNGFYFFDTNSVTKTKKTLQNYSLVQNVTEQKPYFAP